MLNNRLSANSTLNSLLLKKTHMYPIVIFILLVLMFWIIMIFQNSNNTNTNYVVSENA